jgi:hypothetical protein
MGIKQSDLMSKLKNNIEKFDDDFRFQLTKEEWDFLRSKISTSKSETGSGGRRYLAYAFTEQGIYMLMTVVGVKPLKNDIDYLTPELWMARIDEKPRGITE